MCFTMLRLLVVMMMVMIVLDMLILLVPLYDIILAVPPKKKMGWHAFSNSKLLHAWDIICK